MNSQLASEYDSSSINSAFDNELKFNPVTA